MNKSRVNNITISGLDCTAFEVLSRKALHFRKGRKVFTFSPNPRVQRNIYVYTYIYIGWVGFADTQISILPGISRKCNVRSKIWWFTKICNSHYVSHFAAFFIVVGAKTSVAESRMAFASYARGKVNTKFLKWCHPPAPSFRKVNVYIFVFGIVVDRCVYSGVLVASC